MYVKLLFWRENQYIKSNKEVPVYIKINDGAYQWLEMKIHPPKS